MRRTLQAYALYVRELPGRRRPGAARGRSCARPALERLSFEALGWVLPLLSKDAASPAEVAAIRRRLANSVTETAGAAHFAVSYGDGAHLLLHSDRRADAILLEALIADQPRSDLIPKLVAGLLAHRTAGRWANTQENVFVLLALDRYFQTYEKMTPDFVARVWLGERYAGEHAFRGRTTERQPRRDPDGGRSAKRRARATWCSRRRAPGGSTTGSACATRRRSLDARAARPRLRRRARLRGGRRPEGRDARRRRHLADPGRRARARAADDGRARRAATTSRSSTRCPRGSRR